MARYYALVLTLLLAACNTVDIPIQYWISSSCEKYTEEMPLIRLAAESWNKATCTETFRYMGRSQDETFNLNDLTDGQFTIYCLESDENPDADLLVDSQAEGKFAAASAGDILAKMFYLEETARAVYYTLYPEKMDLDHAFYLKYFQAAMTHELGHQLGKGHITGPNPSVMQFGKTPYFAFTPTQLDIDGNEQFEGACELVPCPPRDQCPTRPK